MNARSPSLPDRIERAPEITPPGIPGSLLSWQSRRADAVWTDAQALVLYGHLHNGNGETAWVMGFRDGEGRPCYRRSAKVPARRGMTWAWNTVKGRTKPGKQLAFVPYAQTLDGLSRWAAMDFDAHDGDSERAWRFAHAAFVVLLNVPDLFLILEATGRGWHLFTIARKFRPVTEWTTLLMAVATHIGAPIETGICEVFPSEGTEKNPFGKGVRAPGCWNPSTDTTGEILWENTAPLFPFLSGNSNPAALCQFPDKEKEVSLSVLSGPKGQKGTPGQNDLYRKWQATWAREFAIVTPGTRHDRLARLTGTVFHQLGREEAERVVRAQYRAKTIVPAADERTHLAEFAELWERLTREWRVTLTAMEVARLSLLTTEAERDAFRILRSFARLADAEDRADFPIVRDDLAARLGMTGPGAGQLRVRLTAAGILRLTVPYVPNRAAARYAWAAATTTTEGRTP